MNLSRKRLGAVWPSGRARTTGQVSAGVAIPTAWPRITGAPRIEGDNDKIGDCVETAGANAAVSWFAHKSAPPDGKWHTFANAEVVRAYSAVTGYDPKTGQPDIGTDPHAFFEWWQKTTYCGLKLHEWRPVDPQSEYAVRATIKSGGGVFLVVALSVAQQYETTWVDQGTPGSWGYHAVWADSFVGPLTFGTSWGDAQPIDQSFFKSHVVGAYALDLAE